MTAPSPLRAAFMAHLKEHTTLTVRQGAELVGCDLITARNYFCRLVKSGICSVQREKGTERRSVDVTYTLRCDPDTSGSVATPKREVLSTWAPNQYHDPYHLPADFFGAHKGAEQ